MSVTIKDIAREAGVSYASVSRALSGSRGVSVKTAQRILAVAKKLNYLPNGIARNLVNQRSKTLGLILPDISNPFLFRYCTGRDPYGGARRVSNDSL